MDRCFSVMSCSNVSLTNATGLMCCPNGTFLWNSAGLGPFVSERAPGCPLPVAEVEVLESSGGGGLSVAGGFGLVLLALALILLCLYKCKYH